MHILACYVLPPFVTKRAKIFFNQLTLKIYRQILCSNAAICSIFYSI